MEGLTKSPKIVGVQKAECILINLHSFENSKLKQDNFDLSVFCALPRFASRASCFSFLPFSAFSSNAWAVLLSSISVGADYA